MPDWTHPEVPKERHSPRFMGYRPVWLPLFVAVIVIAVTLLYTSIHGH